MKPMKSTATARILDSHLKFIAAVSLLLFALAAFGSSESNALSCPARCKCGCEHHKMCRWYENGRCVSWGSLALCNHCPSVPSPKQR